MPEVKESQCFQEYCQNFISSVPASSLQIIGLYNDAKAAEQQPMKEREDTLLAHAKSLDSRYTAFKRTQWASKIFELAKAVPDTHGLMVHPVRLAFSSGLF